MGHTFNIRRIDFLKLLRRPPLSGFGDIFAACNRGQHLSETRERVTFPARGQSDPYPCSLTRGSNLSLGAKIRNPPHSKKLAKTFNKAHTPWFARYAALGSIGIRWPPVYAIFSFSCRRCGYPGGVKCTPSSNHRDS